MELWLPHYTGRGLLPGSTSLFRIGASAHCCYLTPLHQIHTPSDVASAKRVLEPWKHTIEGPSQINIYPLGDLRLRRKLLLRFPALQSLRSSRAFLKSHLGLRSRALRSRLCLSYRDIARESTLLPGSRILHLLNLPEAEVLGIVRGSEDLLESSIQLQL